MHTEVAVSSDNMCHNHGQGGDVPVKCIEQTVQTKLGGGVCQLVSQGNSIVLLFVIQSSVPHLTVFCCAIDRFSLQGSGC